MKKFILKLVDGNSHTTLQKWKLRKDETYLIGRSDKADIQIQADSVSRKHAEISVSEHNATIKDLNSDKAQAKPEKVIILKSGSKIHLGDSPNFLHIKEKERRSQSNSYMLEQTKNIIQALEEKQKKVREKEQRAAAAAAAAIEKEKALEREREREREKERERERERERQRENTFAPYASNNLISNSFQNNTRDKDRERSRDYNKMSQSVSKWPAAQASSLFGSTSVQKSGPAFQYGLQSQTQSQAPAWGASNKFQQFQQQNQQQSQLPAWGQQQQFQQPAAAAQTSSSSATFLPMDAKEKRKLLWSNKKQDNLDDKAQIYGQVDASSEETNKFFKLMGFKQSVDGKSVGLNSQNFFIKKSGNDKQTMIKDLEYQFNEGVKRKSGGRGGIGTN